MNKGSLLEKGWVLANHIFMSIHVAFLFPYYIERILESLGIVLLVHLLPSSFGEEVVTGIIFAFITGYLAIGIHERGHFIESVRQITLNEKLLPEAQKRIRKLSYDVEMLLKSPLGKFPGIKRAGISYYIDAPFNLAVAAAGPRASRNMAAVSFPICVVSIIAGLLLDVTALLYIGRIFMGLAVVGFLDYKIADPGQYKKYVEREKAAALQKEQVKIEEAKWLDRAVEVATMMRNKRIQEVTLSTGELVRAPWGFRNSGMGGRHTEKEYPESNISMQESMFIPLTAKNYEDAQRMTVELQTRLMQIIEKTEGCRVMGIGLEGGIATYISKDSGDIVPEQKLWRLMKRAIEDLGLTPGTDVAIAFDPAASELENAYREKFEQTDVIGTYLFWRDKEQVVMNREDILNLYRKALDDGIPIISIEDGFAEDDDEGWAMLMDELGEELFVIGDDFITTNDRTIERKTEYVAKDGKRKKLINAALIKANQIGTLTETTLAMLTSLGKGLDLVISHRSKSPNDDMEAQIAMASMSLGLKAGGGANTERLFKYGSIIKLMKDAIRAGLVHEGVALPKEKERAIVEGILKNLEITGITAYEEATNAGIPTVGVKVNVGIGKSGRFRNLLVFTGSTPLGTSAGTGEAIHLVDSIIESCESTKKFPELFDSQEDGTYRFRKEATEKTVREKKNARLQELYERSKRYGGKGCLNAVANVEDILSKLFVGEKVSQLGSLLDIDNMLMNAELELAQSRGKLKGSGHEETTLVMQRKGNLGMNAILSLSLALGRLVGAIHGKDLWEVIRDQMEEGMARVIADNGGVQMLPPGVSKKVKVQKGQAVWEALRESLSFHELVLGLQTVDARRKEGTGLNDLLRKALPVYEVRK